MHAPTHFTDLQVSPPAVNAESGERNILVNATFVHLMITVTIAIVLAMTALIFYRSQTVVEPTAAIIISGDKYEQGTKIVVREYDSLSKSEGPEVAKTTLTGENQYVTPILVEPGEYHLVVTAPDQQVLIDEKLNAVHLRSTTVDLPTSIVVIGNGSFADAQIAVGSADDNSDRVVARLSAENNYRATIYRFPGRSQIAVTHNGKTLVDQEFEIHRVAFGEKRPNPVVFQLAPKYETEEAEFTSP